jgi:hypothetical protein
MAKWPKQINVTCSTSASFCGQQLTVRAAENPCTPPAALFALASAASIPPVTK